MGRWRLSDGPGRAGAVVSLRRNNGEWRMTRQEEAGAFRSADADTARIWWTESGVHQNMTFAVQPDPVSGAHCWHQAVRVGPARPGDRNGDVVVHPDKSHEVFRRWLGLARSALRHSPDGTRRPYWLLRPVRPERQAYQLSEPPGEPA